MIPGNAKIVKCPYCGTKKELFTMVSGNTIRATYWSDNKRIAPMLPMVSPVQKCPGCGKYYEEGKNHCGEGNSYSFDLGELTFPEWKEAYAQFQAEGVDEKTRNNLRYWLIHSYNDYFHRSEEAPKPTDEDFEFFSKTVVEFIDSFNWNSGSELLMKAELYREANKMQECRQVLDSIPFDQLNEDLKAIFNGIRLRMEKNDHVVFQLFV